MESKKTVTGKIEVADEQIAYTATLMGDWTIAQVKEAFGRGYDTLDADEGDETECDLRDADGQHIAGFTLVADGKGGIKGDAKVALPHAVDWQ